MWWKTYKENFILMLEYIKTLKKRKDLENFFEDYKTETMIRMVFESNTLENEGLNLEGTKRLFSEILQPIFLELETKLAKEQKEERDKNMVLIISEELKRLTSNLNVTDCNDERRVSYKDQEKEFTTTLNHLMTISMINAIFKESKDEIENYKDVFNANTLKEYHGYMNNGLKNNDNGKPGEYRVDGAYINMDTIFLQPSLIPQAIDKAFDSLLTSLAEGKNIYITIMLFVAKFIKIHPFGDGNGRLSRIILNLAFLYNEVPFYLILRSNSKDKKRYIDAMSEFYKKGKLEKFISVVSLAFLRQIKEINDNLEMAGITPIEPTPLDEIYKNKILLELNELKK